VPIQALGSLGDRCRPDTCASINDGKIKSWNILLVFATISLASCDTFGEKPIDYSGRYSGGIDQKWIEPNRSGGLTAYTLTIGYQWNVVHSGEHITITGTYDNPGVLETKPPSFSTMRCVLSANQNLERTSTKKNVCKIGEGSLMPTRINNYLENRCDGEIGLENISDTEWVTFHSDPIYEIRMGSFYYDLIGSRKCSFIRVSGSLVKE